MSSIARLLLTQTLLVPAAPAVAQCETAAPVGTITDASGALVTGATITVTNASTGISDPIQPFGDAARNGVRGPMSGQTDLAPWRRIPLRRDGASLELRAECFDLVNRSNFRAPNGNRSAAAFGTITQTRDPRPVPPGAKVLF